MTSEELIEYINMLPESDVSYLNRHYDENFNFISQKVNKEERSKIQTKLQLIINKLIRLKNDPNYKLRTRKKEKVIQTKRYKNLSDELNQPKEIILNAIEKLLPEEQTIFYKVYDKDLNKISPLNKDVTYFKIKRIKKKIVNIIENPNVDYNKSRRAIKKRTLYDLLETTQAELINAINKLPETDKVILRKRYDEDFKIKIIENMTPQNKNHLNNQLSRIRKSLKSILFPSEKRKTIYLSRKITKEQIDEYKKKLLPSDQRFIAEFFGENYILKSNMILDESQKNKLKKIRINLLAIIKNPEGRILVNQSLTNRLNVDVEELKNLIRLLPDSDQKILLKYYDEESEFEKRDNIDRETIKYINASIITKLRRYQKGVKPKHISQNNKSKFALTNIKDKREEDKLNILEMIIMTGLLTGENYSISSISEYLGIDENIVKDIIRNYLLNIQEKFDEYIKQNKNTFKRTRTKDKK